MIFFDKSRLASICALALSLAACGDGGNIATGQGDQSLAAARKDHPANIVTDVVKKMPPPIPPADVMTLVKYPSAVGDLKAYLTKSPADGLADGKRHPAIIWISGGDNALFDVWSPQPEDNDQSAAIFNEKGLVVLYPSFRGLDGNPGKVEGYYGELDDIVAATRWLKQQPNVDPEQVYLGGHSTGATMALLAAEYDDEWAGVVSVGPVTDPRIYGTDDYLPIAKDDEKGAQLRAPVNWLASIKNPTFVIEGDGRGNLVDLEEMRDKNNNPQVRFIVGKGCDHFSVLRPASSIAADAIVNRQFGTIADNKSFETLCR